MCDSTMQFGDTDPVSGVGPVTLHCAHAPRKGRRRHSGRSVHFAVINHRWISWTDKAGLDLATTCLILTGPGFGPSIDSASLPPRGTP